MTDTHDSYLQSDARQEAISAQKELFLRGLPVDTTVGSDFVLRSWQRSRRAGVDPVARVAWHELPHCERCLLHHRRGIY